MRLRWSVSRLPSGSLSYSLMLTVCFLPMRALCAASRRLSMSITCSNSCPFRFILSVCCVGCCVVFATFGERSSALSGVPAPLVGSLLFFTVLVRLSVGVVYIVVDITFLLLRFVCSIGETRSSHSHSRSRCSCSHTRGRHSLRCSRCHRRRPHGSDRPTCSYAGVIRRSNGCRWRGALPCAGMPCAS